MLFLVSVAAIGVSARQNAEPLTINVQARAQQPGELVIVDVTTREPAATLHVRAFDRDWLAYATSDTTWRAILGIDLDVEIGDHMIAVRADGRGGTARQTHVLTVTAKSFRTRNLTVDNAFVNPPASTQERIAREAAELNRIWRMVGPAPLWTGAFLSPVPHEANSAFGTRSVFNGQPRSPHGGADFLSPSGTPVKSPGAGIVRLAGDLYYTGGTVVVDHGLGLISLFAHLSAVDVKADDRVEAGQVLGKVGATGRVTGAHLHWTLRVNGTRVDPLSLLEVLGTPAR
jgi:murein DD-endopeptidase MepM/ murein hydrolase activator NlpD